jgi:predicted AlkP superfamily pyrophosphatase or phosphodiesterase
LRRTTSLAAAFAFSLYLKTAPLFRAPLPAAQRMVVVISLDGFPAYALEDPKLPVPNLRRLIKTGASASRMHPVNPTVTWPNHTTMVTGVLPPEHGLFYNGTAVRTGGWPPVKIDFSIEKQKMVHAVTIYDLAHQAGLTTAQMDWVAINNAPTITWDFPERATSKDPLVREMIGRGILTASDVDQPPKATILWRDQIWTKAAEYVIAEHKPNLLLLHLLSLDSTQHTYGPKALAAYDGIAFLDGCVGGVLSAIHSAGLENRTTVLVVSDHGFKPFHKQIRPALALEAAGLGKRAFVIPEGGSAMIYVDKSAAGELVPQVRKVFTGAEGIARIAGRADFPELGLPDPAKESQAPDVVLFAKDDYAFGNSPAAGGPVIIAKEAAAGAHGYLNTDPEMDAIFIVSGYNIRHTSLGTIKNLEVAPILAALLQVRLRHVSGAVPKDLFIQ